ncbi:hypothetical protein RIF29_14601 [Crotalaria pallida]|uniref:Uncharacterized protein n=1 Tax=Crotalaria pallida TaxID=3830 RepID=A0AAN9FDP2_CROPI
MGGSRKNVLSKRPAQVANSLGKDKLKQKKSKQQEPWESTVCGNYWPPSVGGSPWRPSPEKRSPLMRAYGWCSF